MGAASPSPCCFTAAHVCNNKEVSCHHQVCSKGRLCGLVAEVRWALLRPTAAVDRLRATRLCGRLREQTLTDLMYQQGAALLLDSLPSWGPNQPDWQESSDALATLCSCPSAGALMLVSCCWTCGGDTSCWNGPPALYRRPLPL